MTQTLKRYFLPTAFFLFLFLATTFASFKYFSKDEASLTISPLQSIATPTPTIVSPHGVYSALLLGQGNPSHEGSKLTDSIMVVNLDTTNKTVTLIFIPRDLWVPLPQKMKGKNKIKINEAYSLGGLDLIKQTVSTSIDLPINFSILVDFNYFTQIIDLLGGVDIIIDKTLDDYYYPIAGKELDDCEKTPEELAAINATMSGFLLEKQYACRYEHLHFDAGKTHLDGATALKFARSRHSDQNGGDFDRGLRQQAILIGLKNRLISLGALKNIEKLFAKMSRMVTTDLSPEALTSISSLIINPREYQVKQIVLSEENVLQSSKNSRGQYILIPKAGEDNFSEIHNLFKKPL